MFFIQRWLSRKERRLNINFVFECYTWLFRKSRCKNWVSLTKAAVLEQVFLKNVGIIFVHEHDRQVTRFTQNNKSSGGARFLKVPRGAGTRSSEGCLSHLEYLVNLSVNPISSGRSYYVATSISLSPDSLPFLSVPVHQISLSSKEVDLRFVFFVIN